MKTNSVLIVCTANICRSAIAEQIMRHYYPNLIIKSAGIQALLGKPIDKPLVDLATSYNINCKTHQATQINTQLTKEHKIILVMQQMHYHYVVSTYPQVFPKVHYLSKWINNQDIDDPYKRTSLIYTEVFKHIMRACLAWGEKLTGDKIVCSV